MKKNHICLKDKMKYWFDSIMSKGMGAKIMLLVTGTVLFIILIGIMVSLYLGQFGIGTFDSMWMAMLYMLDADSLYELSGGVVLIFLMFMSTLFGLIFTAILIGFVNDGIMQKMEALAKGRGRVLEMGHTIILGFNESTYVILNELIEANKNQKEKQAVVILDEMDTVEMEDMIHQRFRSTKETRRTKIICRHGSVYNLNDLEMCSIKESRAVIINTKTDFETTKAILACTSILNRVSEESESYSVAVIFDCQNEEMAQIAGCDNDVNDRLELLSFQKTLARIVVHTSRQPGLSMVFTELFNFDGNEFYIIEQDAAFERLYGKSVREINHYLKNTIAVGVWGETNGIIVDRPSEVVFNRGDSLILVEEDDDALQVETEEIECDLVCSDKIFHLERATCIILGARTNINDILYEEANYLPENSLIVVADEREHIDIIDEGIQDYLSERGIGYKLETGIDIYTKNVLDTFLHKYIPDNVLVLTDQDAEDYEAEDEKTLKLILYLRDYRKKSSKYFGITSEFHAVKNQELVAATESDDFIISRHIAALLMSQIAQTRQMKELFEVLLDSEGFEVYMKRAVYYVPLDTEMDLYTIIDAVAKKGEILIGIRMIENGKYQTPIVNPPKYDAEGNLIQYSFKYGDYLVVLAEGMEIVL